MPMPELAGISISMFSTREDKVQNVVNTESFGIGIRVITNGTWGFASTLVLRIIPDLYGRIMAGAEAVMLKKAFCFPSSV